jgi:hypothetical protein
VIDFSGISDSKLAGRAVLPLQLIPDSAVARILQGSLRGKRWIAGSSNHVCWPGSFGLPKPNRVIDLVQRTKS